MVHRANCYLNVSNLICVNNTPAVGDAEKRNCEPSVPCNLVGVNDAPAVGDAAPSSFVKSFVIEESLDFFQSLS